jgi:SAM-dependent methyltransferase
VDAESLHSFATKLGGNIWIGCVKEAVSKNLGDHPNVFRSEYIDGLASGDMHEDIQCQDIQATTFPDNFFDLIISEDVLEHVPDPAKAFREIHRILRPGGKHIFTIPIDWSAPESYARAIIQNGDIVHLHEPEIHGDPFRKDGVLAFYTFGRDVIDNFCTLTGPTRMFSAHGDRMFERGFLIYNSWVFVSEKEAA